MSRMDAAFLAMERPNQPRHLGTLMIFGPGDGRPAHLRRRADPVAERLPLVPSARRVVVEVPLGLGRPSWGRTAASTSSTTSGTRPCPGAAATPRWPASSATPTPSRSTARGRCGSCGSSRAWPTTASRCTPRSTWPRIDDTTGAELMTALLDTDPDGPARRSADPEPVGRPAAPGPLDLVGRFVGPLPDQLRWAAGFPGRLAERALRAAGEQWPGLRETAVEIIHRTPGLDALGRAAADERRRRRLRRAPDRSGAAAVVQRADHRAPPVRPRPPADRRRPRRQARRRHDVQRRRRRRVRRRAAALAAGPRRAADVADRRHRADAGRPAPSGRRDDAHVAGLVVPLPTNVADPAERLARTHDALAEAKERHAAVPASLMQDVSMFAPPAVAAMAGRLVGALPHRRSSARRVNLAITNVPGPRRPVHLAGQPLESSHPALSISDLTPLHIGVQSGPGRRRHRRRVVPRHPRRPRRPPRRGTASSWPSSSPPSPAGERRLPLLLERRDAFGVVGGTGDAALGRPLGGEHGGELIDSGASAHERLDSRNDSVGPAAIACASTLASAASGPPARTG